MVASIKAYDNDNLYKFLGKKIIFLMEEDIPSSLCMNNLKKYGS